MENLNLSIRHYGQSMVGVKRFSYYYKGELVVVKPTDGERFFLHEDYLGAYSMVFVVCIVDNAEVWRQNMNSIVRITYENAVSVPGDSYSDIPYTQ